MFQHFMCEGPGPWQHFGADRGRCSSFARFGARPGHFERFFASGSGGRERIFDGGDLQLIILSLLAEKPSYGYELIKAIEEKMAGGYAPSPGVVYPTLTLLEERGFASVVSTEGSRKVYGITEEGRKELQAQAARLEELNARVNRSGSRFRNGRSPEIMHALKDLHRAILLRAARNRSTGEAFTAEQIKRIVEVLEKAAQTIDAV